MRRGWIRLFGEKLESALMTVVMVFSFVMAIGIFYGASPVYRQYMQRIHPIPTQ